MAQSQCDEDLHNVTRFGTQARTYRAWTACSKPCLPALGRHRGSLFSLTRGGLAHALGVSAFDRRAGPAMPAGAECSDASPGPFWPSRPAGRRVFLDQARAAWRRRRLAACRTWPCRAPLSEPIGSLVAQKRRFWGRRQGFPGRFPYCGRNAAMRFRFQAKHTRVHSF